MQQALPPKLSLYRSYSLPQRVIIPCNRTRIQKWLMSSLRSNLVIRSAAIANCMVALVTLRVWGWNPAGFHAAARNSARFSAMWFAIAFAAPGLTRFVRGLPSGTTFLRAWFAAHLVHFASVAILIATFERTRVADHPGQTVLVVLFGSSIVIGAALTIASHSRLGAVIHNVLLYVVFGIFMLAFVRDPAAWLHVLAAALVLALALRVTARIRPAEVKTSAG